MAHLCAVHATNNLLYGAVFTPADIASVWRLLPFLESTGELHGCLAPTLREIKKVLKKVLTNR